MPFGEIRMQKGFAIENRDKPDPRNKNNRIEAIADTLRSSCKAMDLNMNVDSIDKSILEYVASEEPWHILCGAFYHHFDSPSELIERVFRLFEKGLITIPKAQGTSEEPSYKPFKREAEANNWFENDLFTDGPWWNIVATEEGFRCIKDRFESR